MPPPMTSKTFQETMEYVHTSYIEAANKSMKAACDEIREELLGDNFDEDTVVDVDISADGSWQKRGFSSLNGVITIISLLTGNCLSYDAIDKKCKACESWESKIDTAEYHRFLETHECSINHLGSAGLMKPSSVIRCFKRSVETLKPRYENFIGDGDLKAFLEVVKADPYDGFPVKKGECIGHIQKRVGSRLRKLKKEYVSKKLKDGKTLRGRLADKDINRLQNYFGIAIRTNCHSVVAMQKFVGAVLCHCSEANDPVTRHMFCDKGGETWCKYQKAKFGAKDFVDKPGITIVIS